MSCLYRHRTALDPLLTPQFTRSLWAALLPHLRGGYHRSSTAAVADRQPNEPGGPTAADDGGDGAAGQRPHVAPGKRRQQEPGSATPSKVQRLDGGGGRSATPAAERPPSQLRRVDSGQSVTPKAARPPGRLRKRLDGGERSTTPEEAAAHPLGKALQPSRSAGSDDGEDCSGTAQGAGWREGGSARVGEEEEGRGVLEALTVVLTSCPIDLFTELLQHLVSSMVSALVAGTSI